MGSRCKVSRTGHGAVPGGAIALPLLLVAALLAGAGPLAGTARAQPEVTQIRAELERTDRILERARDQIQVSITGHASDYLGQAIELQGRAWDNYKSGRERHRVALQLTIKARDLARRAIETAALEIRASEKVRDLIESTRDLIDRIAAQVQETGDEQARRLLEAGIRQIQLAQEAYRAGDFQHAIRMASASRDLVQRARDRLRVREGEGAAVEATLERTEIAFEEIAIELARAPDEKAARHIREARRHLDAAWERHRAGQARAAIRLAAAARRATLDAMLLLSRTPQQAGVERALRAVGESIEDLGAEIAASGSAGAADLLDSARARHREAVREAEGGRLGRALDLVRLSDRFLKRAADAAGIR